mgnify:CR=1 FL=1
MKFLNGFKTVIGIIGAVATPLVALGGDVGRIATDGIAALPHVYSTVEGAFLTLATLGIIHKAEKRAASR